MENDLCCNCKHFDCYFTKGVKNFRKTQFGWCNKKFKVVCKPLFRNYRDFLFERENKHYCLSCEKLVKYSDFCEKWQKKKEPNTALFCNTQSIFNDSFFLFRTRA